MQFSLSLKLSGEKRKLYKLIFPFFGQVLLSFFSNYPQKERIQNSGTEIIVVAQKAYTQVRYVNYNCVGGKLWVRKAALYLLMSESLIMSNTAFPSWFWIMTIHSVKKFLKIPNQCCHCFQMKDMRIHCNEQCLKCKDKD